MFAIQLREVRKGVVGGLQDILVSRLRLLKFGMDRLSGSSRVEVFLTFLQIDQALCEEKVGSGTAHVWPLCPRRKGCHGSGR